MESKDPETEKIPDTNMGEVNTGEVDWKSLAVAAALLLLFFFQGCSIALNKSNTWDETGHILAGYVYLEEDFDGIEPAYHPVLGRVIIALPLVLFYDLTFDTSVRSMELNPSRFFHYSTEFIFENNVDGRRLLFFSRMTMVLLGTVLGIFVFLWSRLLWGVSGGLLSLFLYSLSPNILAHSTLTTTDFPGAAFIFIASYFLFRLGSERLSAKGAVLSGFTLACALTSKHTAILITPLLLFTFILNARREDLRRSVLYYLLLLFTAYVTIWGIYGFRYQSTYEFYTPLLWMKFQGLTMEPVITAMRNLKVLPETYLYSLTTALSGSDTKRSAFLMGMHSITGWWYYFPLAFMIKTPLTTIVFFFISIFLAFKKKTEFLLSSRLLVLLPILIFFLVMSRQSINIGIRHILPIFPFVITMAGSVAVFATGGRRRKMLLVFCAALIFHAYSVLSVHPSQLAYFNELIGGPKNGYKYLVDSNLDWGQDLPGLKQYMDENDIESVKLAYFGLSNPEYYGIKYEYLPSYINTSKSPQTRPRERRGYYAISATLLQGVYLPGDFYSSFRDREPVARIGYSIFVYKLD